MLALSGSSAACADLLRSGKVDVKHDSNRLMHLLLYACFQCLCLSSSQRHTQRSYLRGPAPLPSINLTADRACGRLAALPAEGCDALAAAPRAMDGILLCRELHTSVIFDAQLDARYGRQAAGALLT